MYTFKYTVSTTGFPGGSVLKNLLANAGAVGFDPRSERKIPLEKEMETIPVFLSGKFHGQRSLAGYSPCDGKSIRQDLQLNNKALSKRTSLISMQAV